MLIKSLVLGAVLVSTPLFLMSAQDPLHAQRPGAQGASGVTTSPEAGSPAAGSTKADTRTREASGTQDPKPNDERTRRARAELEAARRDLDAAKRELQEMERQLGEVLDTLDSTFERQRERSCSPSRNRALMSHYQWLDRNNHPERADKALARLVEQAGDDVGRLNSLAWDLMTDDDTAGKFDRLALALAERMEQQMQRHRQHRNHRYIDTVALARFLNGEVARAIELQTQAIASGGDNDDYRRRLRTYQAAQVAVAKAAGAGPDTASDPVAAAAVASKEDDE